MGNLRVGVVGTGDWVEELHLPGASVASGGGPRCHLRPRRGEPEQSPVATGSDRTDDPQMLEQAGLDAVDIVTPERTFTI
jgi:predicted dehydrogenase